MMGMYKLYSDIQILVDIHPDMYYQVNMALQAGMYPVYKQLGGNNFLLVDGNGFWRVLGGLMYSNNDPTPPSPPTKGWRYWDNGWKDDQTVQLLPACETI